MKNVWCIAALFIFFLLQGCSSDWKHHRQARTQQWMQKNGKIKILTTTAMINDLVQQVGGQHVDSISLIQGDLDPHSYQLVKGDDEKLAFAQIIFYNGLGLEHGPGLYTYLNHHSKAIALGELISKQSSSYLIHVQGQKDPHIWMDISLWSRSIPFIVETLSLFDPAHAADYHSNGERVLEEMKKVHREVKEIMAQVPEESRYLVSSHDAFNYFGRAYLSEEGEVESGAWEKRVAAPEGLAPESQLSPVHIRALIDHMMRYHIHVLFPESNVNRDSIKKIVLAGNEEGLTLRIACCPLYADAMGPPGSEGDSYLKMMLYNARTLASQMDNRPESIHSSMKQNE